MGVASERRFRFSSLSQQRSLPTQNIRQKRVEAVFPELGQCVVVQTQGFGALFPLLGDMCHFDEQVCALYVIRFAHAHRLVQGKSRANDTFS